MCGTLDRWNQIDDHTRCKTWLFFGFQTGTGDISLFIRSIICRYRYINRSRKQVKWFVLTVIPLFLQHRLRVDTHAHRVCWGTDPFDIALATAYRSHWSPDFALYQGWLLGRLSALKIMMIIIATVQVLFASFGVWNSGLWKKELKIQADLSITCRYASAEFKR